MLKKRGSGAGFIVIWVCLGLVLVGCGVAFFAIANMIIEGMMN